MHSKSNIYLFKYLKSFEQSYFKEQTCFRSLMTSQSIFLVFWTSHLKYLNHFGHLWTRLFIWPESSNHRVKSKLDGTKERKWTAARKKTALSQTGRSFEPMWTVQDDSERSFEPKWTVIRLKVESPKMSKWTKNVKVSNELKSTVSKRQNGRSKIKNIESRRSESTKVGGPNVWKWPVQKCLKWKKDGLKVWKWIVSN